MWTQHAEMVQWYYVSVLLWCLEFHILKSHMMKCEHWWVNISVKLCEWFIRHSSSFLPSSLPFWQLRVIRAFRSMLEDLEDKRSVNSYHSFHSLRMSRSHHGPRNFGDESDAQHELRFLRTTSPTGPIHCIVSSGSHRGYARSQSARYHSSSPSNTYPNLHLKSQSYENVPLVSKHRASIDAPFNPVCKVSPPKQLNTTSQSDIKQNSETAIWYKLTLCHC